MHSDKSNTTQNFTQTTYTRLLSVSIVKPTRELQLIVSGRVSNFNDIGSKLYVKRREFFILIQQWNPCLRSWVIQVIMQKQQVAKDNNILIFAARKNNLLHCINDTIPFVCCWCKIILKLIPQEYLTNINHDNANQFYGVWSLFLDYIEPDRSSTLLKVLLCT